MFFLIEKGLSSLDSIYIIIQRPFNTKFRKNITPCLQVCRVLIGQQMLNQKLAKKKRNKKPKPTKPTKTLLVARKCS